MENSKVVSLIEEIADNRHRAVKLVFPSGEIKKTISTFVSTRIEHRNGIEIECHFPEYLFSGCLLGM